MAGNEVVSYESMYGHVDLSPQVVKDYLVKGQKNSVTQEELVLFIKLCQAQRVNPFVQGEVHLIKYDDKSPAQMVIGYDTYKRRAEENPSYIKKESGIVVLRGDEVIAKEGACLYPTETLVGGWCKVYKARSGQQVTSYKEVSFSEYDKGNKIWKEKPCTMIEKVAVSQALREAFPTEFEGLYTEEEMPPVPVETPDDSDSETVVGEIDRPITQEERKELFAYAQELFGKERGNELVKETLAEMNIESTSSLTFKQLLAVKNELEAVHKEVVGEAPEEE